MSTDAIDVQWDNNQKEIVRWCIQDGFSWNDFHTAVTATERMINGVTHPVSVLIIANDFLLPDDAGLQHFLRLVTLPHIHQNGLFLAIVDSGSTARLLLQFVQDMYPDHQRAFRRLVFFSSEVRAREFLCDTPDEHP